MSGGGQHSVVPGKMARLFHPARVLAGCILVSTLTFSTLVRAEGLTLSVSTPRVEIRSNFAGVDLVLFGGIQADPGLFVHPRYDVVIIVRGPSAPVDVRQKARTAAIWINSGRQRFADVPSFLALVSTRPLAEVAKPETIAQFHLSLDRAMDPDGAETAGPLQAPYREAVQRLKKAAGLYQDAPRGVIFLNDTLFRTTISLPPEMPLGTYQVEARLIGNGVVLTGQRASLEVVKTGFEDQVAAWARQWPFTYGVTTCLMALLFGWLATMIFRRD
jgi:uncharacterized protein (TIGR02186 family)